MNNPLTEDTVAATPVVNDASAEPTSLESTEAPAANGQAESDSPAVSTVPTGDEQTPEPMRWVPQTLVGWSIPLTCILAASLLIHRFDRELVFFVDTLGNFRWQLVLCLLALTIYQLAKGRWKWGCATLLLLLLPLWELSGFYLPAWQPPAGESKIRLLTLNVLHTNQNYDHIEKFIDEVDADIVCLVEFSAEWHQQYRERLKSYPYTVYQPRGQLMGNVIFSRIPFEPQEREHNELVPSLGLAAGKFKIDGQVINLFNIHTSSPGSFIRWVRREMHMEFMKQLTNRFPTKEHIVMVGDFNCTSHSQSFQRLIRETRMRDSRNGQGIQNSWHSWMFPLQICIDHVLVSERVHVHHRRVERYVGSDHYPVVTELSFGAGGE